MTEALSISNLATQYHNQVESLSKSKDKLPPDDVFACLITRDRIAHLWQENGPPEPGVAHQIEQTDKQLQDLDKPISRLKELEGWRKNLRPTEAAWWWHFQPPPGWLQQYDWLFTALALVFLALSAALITDIAPRFLEGGPDSRGARIVVLQTVVVLLTTGSILTKTGREAAKRILDSLTFIPKHWGQEIAVFVALLILLSLYSCRQSLPDIAVVYNDEGLMNYCDGHLISAQFNYNRALKLNKDYLEAHYNLGVLHEDLFDFEQAKTKYQIALQGGLTLAYNSLARLHILEENYAAAIPLLRTALLKVEQGELRGELVDCEGDPVPAEVLKYELLKNLGWARLGQARYDEARPYLDQAIALFDDQAPAYCLRAQVWEGLADTEAAITDWESCLQYASSDNPDEDMWIGLARQRFQPTPATEENN